MKLIDSSPIRRCLARKTASPCCWVVLTLVLVQCVIHCPMVSSSSHAIATSTTLGASRYFTAPSMCDHVTDTYRRPYYWHSHSSTSGSRRRGSQAVSITTAELSRSSTSTEPQRRRRQCLLSPSPWRVSSTVVEADEQDYSPYDDDASENEVQLCSSSRLFMASAASAASSGGRSSLPLYHRSIRQTLVRGAILRIASDLTGGTPLESIKTRVTTTNETPIQAIRQLVSSSSGGITALWTGTPSRMVEGALVGACFMVASSITKQQVIGIGGSPTIAALSGGLIGGIAQAIVMTPAGMIFTTLNYQRNSNNTNKHNKNNHNAWSVTKQIVQANGILGLYAGMGPMCLRQATNWASRAGLTEIARSSLHLSQYGIWGEIGSGVLGGLGSCWNTPIEAVRIQAQRDVSLGHSTKSLTGYWTDTINKEGYPALFRGITPRAVQAIWQTIFMVVVPNMMGL